MNYQYPNYGQPTAAAGPPYYYPTNDNDLIDQGMAAAQAAEAAAYSTNPYMQPPPRSNYPQNPYGGSRRYSNSPQLGYYDLITGEWRYRNSENFNHSPLLSNYAGETEPPMCENTCECCQAKLPFNCLTISLITSLMLLMMFGLFKLLLGAKPNTTINMNLFQDMIWATLAITVVLVVATIVKYACLKDRLADSWPFNTVFCQRCQLFNAILIDTTPTVYNPNMASPAAAAATATATTMATAADTGAVAVGGHYPSYKSSEDYYTNGRQSYPVQYQSRYANQLEEFL